MLGEALLFLHVAWPTGLSVCLVLLGLIVWWRSVTARPGTRSHQPKRRPPAGAEPRQELARPRWRGVRHG